MAVDVVVSRELSNQHSILVYDFIINITVIVRLIGPYRLTRWQKKDKNMTKIAVSLPSCIKGLIISKRLYLASVALATSFRKNPESIPYFHASMPTPAREFFSTTYELRISYHGI